MKKEDFVPVEQFGKDHWSTMMYVAIKAIDYNGYEVGHDPHMRANRVNFRVLKEQNPKPKYMQGALGDLGRVMTATQGSRLKGGVTLEGHDDWDCLQDIAEAGFFEQTPDAIQPKEKLKFNDLGFEVVRQLMEHKQNGGNFAEFTPNMTLANQRSQIKSHKQNKP